MEFSEIPFSMLFFSHVWYFQAKFQPDHPAELSKLRWYFIARPRNSPAVMSWGKSQIGEVSNWRVETACTFFFPHKFLTYFDTSHVFLQCLVMIYCLNMGDFEVGKC